MADPPGSGTGAQQPPDGPASCSSIRSVWAVWQGRRPGGHSGRLGAKWSPFSSLTAAPPHPPTPEEGRLQSVKDVGLVVGGLAVVSRHRLELRLLGSERDF